MRKIKYVFKRIFLIILVGIISIFLYQIFIDLKESPYSEKAYGTRLLADEETKEKTDDISTVIENASKSVVGISKIQNLGSSVFTTNSSAELGLGSGIIVSKKGYILTNQHVVGASKSCYITTDGGNTYTGKVLWSSFDIDLAILKVDKIFDNYIKIGDSNTVRIGQTVYAIGNPIGFEFQRTVTGGIISAVNRTVKIKNEDGTYSYMSNLIQTDATINPGNSGGPLIDNKGNIIGINTIKITSAEGIGFAIPINIVKHIVEKYENEGDFKEPYLGIYAYDSSVISYVNHNIKFSEGIYIESIIKEGPSSITELKNGDIITQIDSTRLNKLCELQSYIFSKSVGDEIILTIIRNNKEKQVKVTLREK